MSDYQMKENSGTLFKNRNKNKDSHPDFNGTVNVEGNEFYISGWTKVNQDGTKRISLSLKPKEQASVKPTDDDDFI